MWTTMIVMGLAVILEPARTALVVLMLNRPRPILQLATFVACGFVASLTAGLVILFVLRATPVASKAGLNLAQVHLAIGLFALVVAGVVAANITGRARARRGHAKAAVGGDAAVAVMAPPVAEKRSTVSAHIRRLATGDSLWVAAASGLAILPSYNHTAALAVILASDAGPRAQLQALLIFNVVAFALIGFPLVTYAFAPRRTQAFLVRLHAWFRARRRAEVVALVSAVGFVMLALGYCGI